MPAATPWPPVAASRGGHIAAACFGEFLLLRPGSTDQIFTIEQNSPVPGDFPTGPVGRVNIDDSTGYRVGFSLAASNCTSLLASYTRVDGSTSNTIFAQPGNVSNSQIIHPSTLTTGAAACSPRPRSIFDFDLIDFGYHHVLRSSDCYVVNWLGRIPLRPNEQDSDDSAGSFHCHAAGDQRY